MWWLVTKAIGYFFPSFANAQSNAIGMIVLQILRVCTVITLGTIGATYWIFIIYIDKERIYFVFDCASLFFNSMIAVALIISEFPILDAVRNYFYSAWPVLSEAHGVGWLGGALVLMGCNIFGNLNKAAYEKGKLQAPLERLVLATAILALTFGILNIICAMVWRNGKAGITSREIRSRGVMAKGRGDDDVSSQISQVSSFITKKSKGGWGGWGKKKTKDVERGPDEGERHSPIAPGVRRPDSTYHPHNTNMTSERSSNYSLANMSRI